MFKDMKFTKGSMIKNLCLLVMLTLLSGCYGSIALLGPASTTAASGVSGNIARGAFTSTVSYGIKKQTGKTPLEHAIAYAEEKNPERKKETCISHFEITRSEFCTIVKKQVKFKSSKIIEKTTEIVKEIPKNTIKEISKIEKIAKKSIIYNRR